MVKSPKTDSQRTWGGDATRVAEARKRYHQDCNPRYLLPYLSVLYSFRYRPPYAQELMDQRTTLLGWAPMLIASEGIADGKFDSHWEDRLDMVTTYLTWMASRPELTDEERVHCSDIAREYLKDELPEVAKLKHTRRAHTYYLCLLTYAMLHSDKRFVQLLLDSCAKYALGQVKHEHNQRARIFIKLGVLLRKQGDLWNRMRGLYWGLRGCLVRGVPLHVRAKGASALLGIER